MAVVHLGRVQSSFEDRHPQFNTALLPFVTYLGMRYKNWHQSKRIPKAFAPFAHDAHVFHTELANGNYFGEWSRELFQVNDIATKQQFITEECTYYASNPKRYIAGGGSPLNPTTFVAVLFAGFHLLKHMTPNKHHASIDELRAGVESLHSDIRCSHAARFVNGISNRNWYQKEEAALQRLIPDPTKRKLFKEILAICAIRSKANSNVTLGFRAYLQFIKGEDFTGYQPVVIAGLNKLRDSGKYSSKSTKTVNYTKALNGNRQGIAVDRWLVKQFGAQRKYEHNGRVDICSPSIPLQRAIQQYIKTLNLYIKAKPSAIAAMMWYATRTASGEKSDRGYSATLSRKIGTLFVHEEFAV